MEPSYSVVADVLAKLHTSLKWIKALWLAMMPVTVVGAAFCLLQAVKEIAAMLARREERQGVPLFALCEDADGRLMLYARGAVPGLRIKGTEEVLPNPLRQH